MANSLYVDDDYVDEGYYLVNINIVWGDSIIFVPKSAMVLIQTSPTVVYSLDLDEFRLQLKNLEDEPEGMPFTKTHNHNTTVDVGGVTLARVIEILDPYTITFEDGQYAVNMKGANSNVGDRINVNQVSVRSANSAGLVDLDILVAGSYQGRVIIDKNNITGLAQSGTAVPVGTLSTPSDNWADAKTIAIDKGIDTFFVIGNATIEAGVNIDGYTIMGQSPTKSTVIVDPAASVIQCEFFECHLQGTLDGGSTVRECLITSLNYVNGYLHNCILSAGDIVLDGGAAAFFLECKAGVGTPVVDAGGSGQSILFHNYSGVIGVKNKTDTDSCEINLNTGKVVVESSCTAGTIKLNGDGELEDSSGSGCKVIDKMLHGDKVSNIKQLIEIQRDSHSASGTVIYWSPYDGDDTNAGDHIDRSVATFAAALALTSSGNHDVIVAIARDPSGATTANEHIVINKNNVYLRGTGRDFRLFGSNDALDVIEVTGDNCEISGISVSSNVSSTKHQIHLNGCDNVLIKDSWCFDGGHGVLVTDTNDCVFNNVRVAHNTGVGLTIDGTSEHTAIEDCHISSNTDTGIVMSSTGHEISVTNGCVMHSNGGWGIDIQAGSNGIHIIEGCTLYSNALGDIQDNGTGTYDASNMGIDIKFLKDIEGGRWDLVGDQMIFYGEDNTTEIARFDMFDSAGNPTTTGDIFKRTRV